MLNLIKDFSPPLRWLCDFGLISVYVVYYIYWFMNVEMSLDPCNPRSQSVIFLTTNCILFASVLLTLLPSVFIKEIAL